MKTRTKTIFRTFHTGDVIALFPEIPADVRGHYCQSYQRIGQHGAASPNLSHCTRPSYPDEIAELRADLERIGYIIEPRLKVTRKMDETRFAEIAASRECPVSKLLPV